MNNIIIQKRNEIVAINDLTIDQFVSKYIHILQIQKKSKGTIKVYNEKLKNFTGWYRSAIQVGNFKDQLLLYRSMIIDKYNSAKTVNLTLSVIRSFWKWLFENDYIDHDPTRNIKNVEDNDQLKKSSLTKDELYGIFDYLRTNTDPQHKRDRLLFVLLVTTGMRINEVANIEVADITKKDGRNVIYILRKGYKYKSNYVKIPDNAYSLLMEFIGDQEDGYIFNSLRGGGKMGSDTLSRVVKQILFKNGHNSKLYSAHSLRHSFAILFLENGGTIEQLMIEMNHKSITTTMNYVKSFNRMNVSIDLGIEF